jgi:ribosomal protein L13E
MESRDSRRVVRVFGVGLVVVLAAGAIAAPGPDNGSRGYGGGGGGYGSPTPTATVTETATATPTATVTPPPPPDTTAPACNSRIGRGQTARSIRKKGLKLSLQCNENARHVTQVFVSKAQARKLGIKKKAKRRVLVGKKTTLLQANVARKIAVKLNKKAKNGIKRMKRKHVRKLKLTIGTSATDAAKNTSRSSTTKSFKR